MSSNRSTAASTHNARFAKQGRALDPSFIAPGDRILRFRGWSLVIAVIKTKSSLTSNALARQGQQCSHIGRDLG
jgi:hypothetical protein